MGLCHSCLHSKYVLPIKPSALSKSKSTLWKEEVSKGGARSKYEKEGTVPIGSSER